MKKLISMILAVAVLASSVLLINATAADPKGTLVGKSVSGGPGETVEIPVTVDTASTAGVVALGISIGYDQGNLELVSWTNGDFFPAAALTASETIATYPYELQYEDGLSAAKTGKKLLGTLKFKIKDSAVVVKEGYTVNIRMLPGYTYDQDMNDIDFDVTSPVVTVVCKNHKFGAYTYNNDATCQKDGTETATCSVCNKKDTRTKAGSKVNHKFTKYVNDNNATCQKNATETASCDFNCGAKDTREVANSTVKHKFTNYVSNKDATCTADGTKTAKCDYGCGEKDTVADKDSALGHEVKEWTVTEEATLETEGKRTGTCDRCKVPIKEPIPKLTNEVKTGDDAKVEVVIDSDEPFTGYTEVKVGAVATSEADKVDGKDVVGGYKIDIIDADTNEPVAAGKKVKAKIKLTDAMKAAYKDFDVAIDGTALGATVTEDGYLTFTAEAGKLAKVVVVGTKIETNGGNNGSNSGENNGNSGSSTSPKTGEATGAALAVTLFAAAAAGVVLSKKKRG